MAVDPMLLTFESLAEHLRSDGGPARRAAVDHGLDVLLLERNLALTPTERMRQHDEALRLYFVRRRPENVRPSR